MSGFLLDTNVPSELIRARPEPRVGAWLDAQTDEHLFLSVVTLGEIRKGFTILRDAKRRAYLENWLQGDLLPWFAGRILPVTQAVADRWGMLDGESPGSVFKSSIRGNRTNYHGRPIRYATAAIAGGSCYKTPSNRFRRRSASSPFNFEPCLVM